VLVGTMNPEEGELRPQLLDRFGLTVEVAAPREPALRSEVVRRRLAFDAAPAAFAERFAADQEAVRVRIVDARSRVGSVELPDRMLTKIAEVCAAFEVDGLRADIVTARAAIAHAAWVGRDRVIRADVRAAARLALPHRRRRNPFDAPGLDEDLLDRILGDEPEPDPEPHDSSDKSDQASDASDTDGSGGGDDGRSEPTRPPSERASGAGETPQREPEPARPEADKHAASGSDPGPPPSEGDEADGPQQHPAGVGTIESGTPFRARVLTAKGLGHGEEGRRSRAVTTTGGAIGSTTTATGRVHLAATLRAAAPHQHARGRSGRVLLEPADLRRTVTQGRESNLILLCVDASGSMAARKRMESVKTAVLSLLLDAYQRRDKVGMVTFRGDSAHLVLPPTGSIDVAARRLDDLQHGGRTPLAEGLLVAYETLRLERIRDPRRRPLLVVVTDGRATAGAHPLERAGVMADHLAHEGVDSVVIDCESGRFRLGLAARLAARLGAEHLPVDDVAASTIVDASRAHTSRSAREPGSGAKRVA
ncbi:MAG: VWA domain-containing protein, partial [Terracoccus sp.]